MTHKLSILTVVHLNLEGLQRLHECLSPVLSEDVEWVVKDSGRCPATRVWAARLNNPNIRFSAEPDLGIYDALNTAVTMADGEYYLTAGSDDLLFRDSIISFVEDIARLAGYDIIGYPVEVSGHVHRHNQRVPLFVSTAGLVSSHSVGTIIRRSLHRRFGLYDTSYTMLADSLFLTHCAQQRVKFLYIDDKVLGKFGASGISSKASMNRFLEAFRYQRACDSNFVLQVFLLLLRLSKAGLSFFASKIR